MIHSFNSCVAIEPDIITIGEKNDNESASLTTFNQPYTAEEIWCFIVQSGMIDASGVADAMNKKRREEILKNHPYAISQGKDGRWRTRVKDEKAPEKRRMIVKSTKEELEKAICDYYAEIENEERGGTTSLEELYEEWIEFKALSVVDTTIDRVRRDWKRYYQGSEITQKPIAKITDLEIERWVKESIRKHDMGRHQYTNFILIIRQMLSYALRLGIIVVNPLDKADLKVTNILRQEHKKPDHTQVFSDDELAKIRELAWADFEEKAYPIHQLVPLAVMFMLDTGIRVGEACALKQEDVLGNILTVQRMVRYPSGEVVDSTKGYFGDRQLPLVPRAQGLVNAARERKQTEGVSENGYLFSMTGEPVPYTAITKAFYKYSRRACRELKSTHKARKTFVAECLEEGMSINTVRQMVGHKDERTTLRCYCYDRNSEAEKREQLERALK